MEVDRKDLVEHYGTMVATIAHRMIQNREIAKEAAQEALSRCFKHEMWHSAEMEAIKRALGYPIVWMK